MWLYLNMTVIEHYRMARQHCILQAGKVMTRLWSFSLGEKLMWTIRPRWGFSCYCVCAPSWGVWFFSMSGSMHNHELGHKSCAWLADLVTNSRTCYWPSVCTRECWHTVVSQKGAHPPLLWMIFYSDTDCLNGLFLFYQCVLVLTLLMEYSCSVIIASNPGFLFRILSQLWRKIKTESLGLRIVSYHDSVKL